MIFYFKELVSFYKCKKLFYTSTNEIKTNQNLCRKKLQMLKDIESPFDCLRQHDYNSVSSNKNLTTGITLKLIPSTVF